MKNQLLKFYVLFFIIMVFVFGSLVGVKEALLKDRQVIKRITYEKEKICKNTELFDDSCDEHGCSVSNGYVWCEVKNKCLRLEDEECKLVSDVWELDEETKDKAIELGFEGNIVQYNFSLDGEEIYWSNGTEIWKKDSVGEVELLVKAKEFDYEEMKENWETFGATDFEGIDELVKGGINYFELSPDGEYILYLEVGGYSGCCMSVPNIPRNDIWIMKSDGTSKAMVNLPDNGRYRVTFKGWFPDSRKIIFYSQFFDEATQGSPLFIVGVDGKDPQVFTAIYEEGDYPEASDTFDWVPGSGPIFSPDGEKMVYVREAETLWIANVDGSGKKKLLEYDGYDFLAFAEGNIEWTEDGKFLLFNAMEYDDSGAGYLRKYIFDREGNIVFKPKDSYGIISNNK